VQYYFLFEVGPLYSATHVQQLIINKNNQNKLDKNTMDLLDTLNLDKALEANKRAITRLRLIGRVLAWVVFAAGSLSQIFYMQHASQNGHFFALSLPLLLVLFPLASNYVSSGSRRQGVILSCIDAFIFGALIVFISNSFTSTALLFLLIATSLVLTRSIWTVAVGAISATVGTMIALKALPFFSLQFTSEIQEYVISGGISAWVIATALISNFQEKALTDFRNQAAEKNKMFQELSKKLARYLAPQVWKSIFSGKKEVRLETQRKKLVVFFSDIRDFTELSELMEPEAVTAMLNTYLNDMADIVVKHGGTIDKFIGDAILVFFGDPETKGTKKDAQACVAMALEMRKHMRTLQKKWRQLGVERPLEIRMGINTGYCTVGNFGASHRMDYTIIGKEVNLASRLESAAEPGHILISHETFSLVKDRILCRPQEPIIAKGFSRAIPVYDVINYRHEMGGKRSFAQLDTEGFSIHMDLNEIDGIDKERILEALENARNTVLDRIV
jgi:adenylate cyclase